MLHERLRRWAAIFQATPLHPQWLLRFGPRKQELLRPAKGLTLDIGCANRWPEKLLQGRGEYVALDYPPTGGDLYSARPDLFADAAALPFSDSSFDTVLLFEVLEHVAKPQHTLAEIARVLKPGGQLLLTMPFLYPMHDEPHDYQRYTHHGLQRQIDLLGLKLDRIEPSLHSAAAAGLLLNLALGGMALTALRKHSMSAILLPFLALLVPTINLGACFAQLVLPSWPALTKGYSLVASKI